MLQKLRGRKGKGLEPLSWFIFKTDLAPSGEKAITRGRLSTNSETASGISPFARAFRYILSPCKSIVSNRSLLHWVGWQAGQVVRTAKPIGSQKHIAFRETRYWSINFPGEYLHKQIELYSINKCNTYRLLTCLEILYPPQKLRADLGRPRGSTSSQGHPRAVRSIIDNVSHLSGKKKIFT